MTWITELEFCQGIVVNSPLFYLYVGCEKDTRVSHAGWLLQSCTASLHLPHDCRDAPKLFEDTLPVMRDSDALCLPSNSPQSGRQNKPHT